MDPDQRQKVTAKDGDKTITRTLKYIEKVHRQQILFHKDIAKKTTVINVKVKYLRQLGYDSFLDWLKDPSHIYIGRNMTVYVPGAEKSIWANPFSVDKYGREQCLDKYKKYLLEDKTLLARVQQLQGKVLGCWCKPEGCHGDILAQLADSL